MKNDNFVYGFAFGIIISMIFVGIMFIIGISHIASPTKIALNPVAYNSLANQGYNISYYLRIGGIVFNPSNCIVATYQLAKNTTNKRQVSTIVYLNPNFSSSATFMSVPTEGGQIDLEYQCTNLNNGFNPLGTNQPVLTH